ncbi:MAG: CoA-binding protein [Nitrospirota bacterium]
MENVAVVGASPKKDRYSYQAMKALEKKGHNPIPVATARLEVLGRKAYPSLAEIPEHIDTITVYISAAHQTSMLDEAVRIKPRRIIFNPGTENHTAYTQLRQAGIEVVESCTLIMLSSNEF